MISPEAASRYAKALFNLTEGNAHLEKLMTEIKALSELFCRNPLFFRFFNSPKPSTQEKERVLNKSLENRLDAKLIHFLTFLLIKGRFSAFPEIAKAYCQMVKEKLGVEEGFLALAKAVDSSQIEQLQAVLKKNINKKVTIKETIDPSLIGGGILRVSNRYLDFSLKGKLDKLKKDLLS